MVNYAHRVLKFHNLSATTIRKELRLHRANQMNAHQSLKKIKWNKRRLIIENRLGALHSDIRFFTQEKEFEMPVTFCSGFLVCNNILSRFTHVSILRRWFAKGWIVQHVVKDLVLDEGIPNCANVRLCHVKDLIVDGHGDTVNVVCFKDKGVFLIFV